MGELAQMRCTACRGYEPTLTEAEIEELLPRVPDRQLAERAFGFDDFAGRWPSRRAWASGRKRSGTTRFSCPSGAGSPSRGGRTRSADGTATIS